jgi:hypothetical protein
VKNSRRSRIAKVRGKIDHGNRHPQSFECGAAIGAREIAAVIEAATQSRMAT